MSRKGRYLTFVFIFCLSVLVSLTAIPKNADRTGVLGLELTGERVGAICVSTAYPTLKASLMGLIAAEGEGVPADEDKDEPETKVTKSVKTFGKDPVVLIVHTHATESYLPASKGNYHTKKEDNTVREAGETLRKSLEKEGIGVVHDKTLHDNPSYSDSYTRSNSTISELLTQYPSIICVVDLHRDAIAGKKEGPIQTVDEKKCATYSYVISNGVDTYAANKTFISSMNKIGEEEFSGFTGPILERPYGYNQGLCAKSILLELGNNRNHIDDVNNSAKIYGKILAKALKTCD